MNTKPLELFTNAPPGMSLALQRLRWVSQAARFYHSALPNVVPDRKWARIYLSEGIPALNGELLLDWMTLDSIVHALIGIFEDGPKDSVSSAVRRDVDGLAAALGDYRLAEATLAGAWEALSQLPTPDGPATRQTAITLLDYASRPALRAAAAQLREIIAESGWTRGTCPACGALPLLAELHSGKGGRGEGSARVLRCARCESAWSMSRLACPACDERDHTKLRYLHVEGEMEYRRAECCTTCGFFLKAVATLDPLKDDALLDADLSTLGLDALAIEAGYHRRGPLNAV